MSAPKGNCDNPEVNCEGCEFQSPFFCHLNDEELDLVRQNRLSVLFRKGETIRKQGTFMSHVISLTSGMAKVYIEGFNGKNSIISIVQSSSFIGGPGIYLDKVHHYSVTALTDARVCFIDLEVFKKLIDTNKAFAHELMKDFSRTILSVYNRLVNLTQKQMPGRMADTLLYVFEDVLNSNKLDATLSKQDLAELSGMARDSAIKVLRNFQNAGIIRFNDHEIELLDLAALQRISRTG